MRTEKTVITEDLIREVRELAKLSDELAANADAIRSELAKLQEQLGIQQRLGVQPPHVRTSRPN